MTLARPVVGGGAVYESFQHKPWQALGLLIIAQTSDMDGWFARKLRAESKAGAIVDPISDGALRLETAAIIAPIINPVMGVAAAALEAVNLGLNAKNRKNGNEFHVPQKAKVGTATQSVGAAITLFGQATGKPFVTLTGSVMVAKGSIDRTVAYANVLEKNKSA